MASSDSKIHDPLLPSDSAPQAAPQNEQINKFAMNIDLITGVFFNKNPHKEESQSHQDEEEDDEDPELSDGEDIRADVREALDDVNFSFNGSFYHSNILATAPNPCLHIAGLGLVGLPLSERDAKAIVSCATLAPFGHGERTVVDKEVRDTWEIEPTRLAFANPEWNKYVNSTVCLEVCIALGVSITGSLPKMELYKLLLYERGSHFLPHQDTLKAEGMFATVVILLPSAYTGGQVVVSHASTTKIIDLAPSSLLSTAVLAWYTDVKHEVKPVTSGYRLALSYNLIHVARPHVPMPTLPEMVNPMAKVGRVLRKWSDGRYKELPDPPLLAYLLDHQYSEYDLGHGLKALKGADAHRVRALRDIAAELGYLVGLANLEHNVSGCADDSGYDHRRSRHGYYDEYDERESTPGMLEVNETSTSIKKVVDLNGDSVLSSSIDLQDDNLVQEEPFEGKEPDDTEYEGYMGNGAGELQHWYHRTVLVLMHQDDVDNVCFLAQGISYALQKLVDLGAHTATVQSAEMRLWANRLLSRKGLLSSDQAVEMLNITLVWRDAEMFNTLIQCSIFSLELLNLDTLWSAVKIFSFENVKASLETLLSRSTKFSAQLKVISSIKQRASATEAPAVQAWCDQEVQKVLSSYARADVSDIPTIISLGQEVGWTPFFTILIPRLFKLSDSYLFWIAFFKAVQGRRQSLFECIQSPQASTTSNDMTLTSNVQPAPLSSPSSTVDDYLSALGVAPGGKNIVDVLTDKALQMAAKQWSHAPASYVGAKYYFGTQTQHTNVAQTAKVDRIIEIIDLATMNDNVEVCRLLFVHVLGSPGNSEEKFVQIYTPLISRLCPLLTSKKKDICASPFVDFFQILIGTYLRDILGKKGQLSNSRLRNIGCGCPDCRMLDAFILNPKTSSETFRLAKARRTHLERQIARATDLCSYETITQGSPHGVKVTKRREVVQASFWEYRQKEAKNFLALFGSDSTVSKIMGVRYADVVAALNGTTWFGAGPTDTISSAANSSAAVATAGPSHPNSVISNPGATPTAKGSLKRKNPNVDLGVIDLT